MGILHQLMILLMAGGDGVDVDVVVVVVVDGVDVDVVVVVVVDGVDGVDVVGCWLCWAAAVLQLN